MHTAATAEHRKATASGWIGSVLEYYDFFIYATAASLVFPQVFFPAGNPRVAIIASLATYGVGYVARPIGAFFLGHWGDTRGRKQVLLACLFIMGGSTLAVGLLPTYGQVGMLAPALLVALRLVQGFAVAGEMSGASSMILEHAPHGQRGYYASFTLQGVQAGQILAAAVFLPLARFLPEPAFMAWGWRLPFLASAFVIIAAGVIRRRVAETPAFEAGRRAGQVSPAPVLEAFRHCWRDMLRVTAMMPAAFAALAPPGAHNVVGVVGSMAFGMTVVAALAAWSTRETHRLRLQDLGDPRARPMPADGHERLRAAGVG
jgi:MFS family permease